MDMNLLIDLFTNWPAYDIGEGAFSAVFGFLFVFLGIVLLILIFTALGIVMKKVNESRGIPRRKKKKDGSEDTQPQPSTASEEGAVSPEVIAVISAAIAAYYDGENIKCDFVVKRIKRL